MVARRPDKTGGASWSMEDIPYHRLAHEFVRDDRQLFYIVASASFIESASDIYTDNLIEFFHDYVEIVTWLKQYWEIEELQHGAALKRYVQTAWPDFDWEAAYRTFLAEYLPFCVVDRLAGTRALEMAARCVVETGTAAFYRMLSELTEEPALRELAARISADEVRHYKHFYRGFRRYRALEQPSGSPCCARCGAGPPKSNPRMRSVPTRRSSSASIRAAFRQSDYEAYRAASLKLAKPHIPHEMAIKMLLKPLELNATVGRAVAPAATSASRFFLQRYSANV